MLTSTQTALVQESFALIAPIGEEVAALFYQRLFEIDPLLRRLFDEDMVPQRRKLAQMLTAAVTGLDRPDQLVPAVRDLGRRHVAYGVQDEHYDTVGIALLWSLRRVLGKAFTPEVEEAWAAVYRVLATTMRTAMREGAPA
jgi:hemoglobin-like flavoprotein